MSALVSVALGSALAVTPPAVALRECVGDCDGNGEVHISELVKGVNIALFTKFVGECLGFDSSEDGAVKIYDLVSGVNASLYGCLDPNANYVAVHDWTSPDFDEDCAACHGEKLDEVSLDPSVASFHPRKLAMPVIPGATPNDKCVYCHTDFDLSGNNSAGNLRRPVEVTTCTPCHAAGPNKFYQAP